MSSQTYVVRLNDTATVIRMGQVVVPGVRVSQATTGIVRVMGGVPGPPGKDGTTADAALLQEHINSLTPHPEYDDLPSMSLLFENGLI